MTTTFIDQVNNVIKVTNPKIVFTHNNNEFVWVLQLLTGVKTVYLNGELIKRDYSVWCRSSHYTLQAGEQTYQLRIRQDSSARWDIKEINAPLVATLELDQQTVATKRYSINPRDVVKHFGFSVLAGLIVGFSFGYFLPA